MLNTNALQVVTTEPDWESVEVAHPLENQLTYSVKIVAGIATIAPLFMITDGIMPVAEPEEVANGGFTIITDRAPGGQVIALKIEEGTTFYDYKLDVSVCDPVVE